MNPGSERGILSICLKNPSKLLDVEEEHVEPIHFSVLAHRFIYVAMLYLYSKELVPSPVAIMEVITAEEGKKAIADIGGLEYISSLTDTYISEGSLRIFCKKIIQAYTRKEIYVACEETQNKMISESAEQLNPTELLSVAEGKINNISTNVAKTEEVYKMGENLDDVLKAREENPDVIPGLETGWTKFDSYTGGLQPGDLIFVCARSKTGKSVLLTNWATELALVQQIPCLYIDTEMSSGQQEDRILAKLSGVPHSEIVSGLYILDTINGTGKEKREAVEKAKYIMQKGLYWHIYMPNYSMERITAIAKRYKMQHNMGAMFFDYLKLTYNQATSLKSAQEYQMLGFVSAGLKDLAGTLNIPIVSACQENRTNPKSSDKDETNVGGSDRILQNATKLMFLYNKTEEQIAKSGIEKGNQQLYIAFQRNGTCDCEPIDIMFDRPRINMKEI